MFFSGRCSHSHLRSEVDLVEAKGFPNLLLLLFMGSAIPQISGELLNLAQKGMHLSFLAPPSSWMASLIFSLLIITTMIVVVLNLASIFLLFYNLFFCDKVYSSSPLASFSDSYVWVFSIVGDLLLLIKSHHFHFQLRTVGRLLHWDVEPSELTTFVTILRWVVMLRMLTIWVEAMTMMN